MFDTFVWEKCVLRSSVRDHSPVESQLVLAKLAVQYFFPHCVISAPVIPEQLPCSPLELFLLQISYSECYPFTCAEMTVDSVTRNPCHVATGLFSSITRVNETLSTNPSLHILPC